MDFEVLKFLHILGAVLIGAGLIGVWMSDLRSRQLRELPAFSHRKDQTMTTAESYTGRCLCGDVQYQVRGPSVWKAICYCESCTRSAGTPAVAWAGFEKSRFHVVRGTVAIYESSPGVLRGFCSRCGTTLTYQKDPAVLEGAQDDVYITTRTLDDPNAYPPDEHVFYGERVAWFNVEDVLPHHDRLSSIHASRQLATMNVKG